MSGANAMQFNNVENTIKALAENNQKKSMAVFGVCWCCYVAAATTATAASVIVIVVTTIRQYRRPLLDAFQKWSKVNMEPNVVCIPQKQQILFNEKCKASANKIHCLSHSQTPSVLALSGRGMPCSPKLKTTGVTITNKKKQQKSSINFECAHQIVLSILI